MDEGVDPTQMCQSLVDKVARSRQLKAIADPEVLILFEDWLEELQEEVVVLFREHGPLTPKELAQRLGVSQMGARFLVSKLTREAKL